MRSKLIILTLLIIASLSWQSCKWFEEPEEISETEDLNNFIFEVMKNQSWYLWYEYVPDLNPKDFGNSHEFLEDLKYKELDTWSYLTTIEEHNAHFVDAIYYGHGFAYKFDEDEKMRISFVFKNSPMDILGVKRGWEILAINNVSIPDIIAQNLSTSIFGPSEIGYVNHLTMATLPGDTIEFDVAKAEVKENTVLYSNIYEQTTGKTGYLVFKSFIEPSIEELNTAFNYFASENVNNIILDLRYNGGGLMSVANHLGALLGGTKVIDKLFISYTHNNTKLDNNFEYFFEAAENSINIDKLVVIATGGTASASEAIINGLSPYLDVKIVGDNTHGKPVGMYSFEFNEYLLVPICFQLTNSNGYGDYFDGLPADAYRIDDLTRDWGDINEKCFKESMFYIENGYFSDQAPVKSRVKQYPMPLKGIQKEVGAL